MKNLILLIPLLPLLGFLINGLGRKYLSKSLIGVIGCGTVLGSFIISVYAFLNLDLIGGGRVISATAKVVGDPVLHYFDFINVGSLKIPFAFQIDQLSTLFLLII